MSQVTIYGPVASTYVRTARLACQEKGVSYEMKNLQLGGDEHLRMHPFGKVPVLTHGDFHLYETGAITRYVDRAFPGVALQPKDIQRLSRMDQWMSVISDYMYQSVIRDVVLPRIGLSPLVIESLQAAVPRIEHQLQVLNHALEHSPYLCGPELSLADLFLFPIVFYLKMVPEGESLSPFKNVQKWFEGMAARPSAVATMPSR